MLNSLPALAITYLTSTLPFSLWILRPYIEAIPRSLEEAAMIDGCTRFQAFRKVIVPQAWPGIIATFVFTFVVVWNELLYSLVLISDEPKANRLARHRIAHPGDLGLLLGAGQRGGRARQG